MRALFLSIALLVPAGAARADIPRLNAVCADGIAVHAEAGGPVFINDAEAELDATSPDHYRATLGDVTVTIAIGADGVVDVSYERKDGSHGVCPDSGGGL